MNVIDLFAGAGGWDLGARDLGIDPLGIEWMDEACATRQAAGLRTVQADIAELDPADYPCSGLIASPPCQAYSMAGKGAGRRDVEHVVQCVRDLAQGRDTRAAHAAGCEDVRSMLVIEPLRWALALRPRWVAFEQVPPVLGLWDLFAEILRDRGYHVWTGVLSAERFGVPQTRKRAFLIASLDGPVHPPAPTHQEYVPGQPAQAGEASLFGGALEPWVSMADALGWDGQVGFPRAADEGAATDDGYRERDFRSTDEPAFNLTEKARSWSLTERPATTAELQRDDWPEHRPATTVNGDPRISEPGHHDANVSGSQQANAIRVTEREAAILQSFPPDYPWQGTRSKRFLQIGNAVPPLMARAVLEAVVAPSMEARDAA